MFFLPGTFVSVGYSIASQDTMVCLPSTLSGAVQHGLLFSERYREWSIHVRCRSSIMVFRNHHCTTYHRRIYLLEILGTIQNHAKEPHLLRTSIVHVVFSQRNRELIFSVFRGRW